MAKDRHNGKKPPAHLKSPTAADGSLGIIFASITAVLIRSKSYEDPDFVPHLSDFDIRRLACRQGMAQDHVARSHGGAVVVTLCPVRVRTSHRDYWLAESRPEEWLLIEWPEGEEAPTKYWFSTLPANIAFRQLGSTAKLRWRIERDYQELKQ